MRKRGREKGREEGQAGRLGHRQVESGLTAGCIKSLSD